MIIDIFNHFSPKAYFDRLADFIPGHPVLSAFPRLTTLWDVEARLRLMDEFGDMQHVLSLANPPLELIASPDRTPELARLANDTLAETCRLHPDRFPAFIASLPMNNVEASLQEIDRAVRDLGARGVQVFTNVAGKPLSAPEYRSFNAWRRSICRCGSIPCARRSFPTTPASRCPKARSGSRSAGRTRPPLA
jgi:aminocarboxymuconate-semialdehyde decarboxylase